MLNLTVQNQYGVRKKQLTTPSFKGKFSPITNMGRDLFHLSIKPQSFEDFERRIKGLKISGFEFYTACKDCKPIGKGVEGRVFDLPFSGFEDYVVKIGNYHIPKPNIALFKVDDFAPEKNFGQPIAAFDKKIKVLKRVEGVNLLNLRELGETDALYSDMEGFPQKAYDDYVKDAIFLKKHGYTYDPYAGNIIFNNKTGKLTIIDIEKSPVQTGFGTILQPFVKGIGFPGCKQARQNQMIIIAKLLKACKKMGYNPETYLQDYELASLYSNLASDNKKTLKKLLNFYDDMDYEKFEKKIDGCLDSSANSRTL